MQRNPDSTAQDLTNDSTSISTESTSPKTDVSTVRKVSPKLEVKTLNIPKITKNKDLLLSPLSSPLSAESPSPQPFPLAGGKSAKPLVRKKLPTKSAKPRAKTPEPTYPPADPESTDMGLLLIEDNKINARGMERNIEGLGYVRENKLYKPSLRTSTNAENVLILLVDYINYKKRVEAGQTLSTTETAEYEAIEKEFRNLRIHLMDNQLSGKILGKDTDSKYTCMRGVILSGIFQGILGEDAMVLHGLCLQAGLVNLTVGDIVSLQTTMREKLKVALKAGLHREENSDVLIANICAAIQELGIPRAMAIISSDKNNWDSEPELSLIANIIVKVYGGYNITGNGKSGSFQPPLFQTQANRHAQLPGSRLNGWSTSTLAKAKTPNKLNRLGNNPFEETPKPSSTTDDKLPSFSSSVKLIDLLSPLPPERATSTDSTASGLSSPALNSPVIFSLFSPSLADVKEEQTPSPPSIPGTPLGRFSSGGDETTTSESDTASPMEESRPSRDGLYGNGKRKINITSPEVQEGVKELTLQSPTSTPKTG